MNPPIIDHICCDKRRSTGWSLKFLLRLWLVLLTPVAATQIVQHVLVELWTGALAF
jgi:hypothetical protein